MNTTQYYSINNISEKIENIGITNFKLLYSFSTAV